MKDEMATKILPIACMIDNTYIVLKKYIYKDK